SSSYSVRIPGSETASSEPVWLAVQSVAPRFFEILGAAPVAGREIDRNDVAGGRRVAVVNQAFVRKFLGADPHPLERVLHFKEGEPTYIVGVAADIPHQGLRGK